MNDDHSMVVKAVGIKFSLLNNNVSGWYYHNLANYECVLYAQKSLTNITKQKCLLVQLQARGVLCVHQSSSLFESCLLFIELSIAALP